MAIELSKKSKYWIPKQTYLTLYHYCLQYQTWRDEYNSLDGKKSINYDGMPHGAPSGSAVENIAIKRAMLSEKMKQLEDTAKETEPGLAKWILRGVTDNKVTYNYLNMVMGMPCSKNTYYSYKRKFYWHLNKKHISIGTQ